jgi:hypothetical protein
MRIEVNEASQNKIGLAFRSYWLYCEIVARQNLWIIVEKCFRHFISRNDAIKLFPGTGLWKTVE